MTKEIKLTALKSLIQTLQPNLWSLLAFALISDKIRKRLEYVLSVKGISLTGERLLIEHYLDNEPGKLFCPWHDLRLIEKTLLEEIATTEGSEVVIKPDSENNYYTVSIKLDGFRFSSQLNQTHYNHKISQGAAPHENFINLLSHISGFPALYDVNLSQALLRKVDYAKIYDRDPLAAVIVLKPYIEYAKDNESVMSNYLRFCALCEWLKFMALTNENYKGLGPINFWHNGFDIFDYRNDDAVKTNLVVLEVAGYEKERFEFNTHVPIYDYKYEERRIVNRVTQSQNHINTLAKIACLSEENIAGLPDSPIDNIYYDHKTREICFTKKTIYGDNINFYNADPHDLASFGRDFLSVDFETEQDLDKQAQLLKGYIYYNWKKIV